jgi:hypothetical protein
MRRLLGDATVGRSALRAGLSSLARRSPGGRAPAHLRDQVDPVSLSSFDACFVSFPKCGRTWIRLMLSRAMCLHYGLAQPGDVDRLFHAQAISGGIPELSTVAFSHDDWPQHKRASQLLADKAPLYAGKAVIVLIRDLRDALVSNYFQLTRREGRGRHYTCISDYAFDDVGGADSFIAFYNNWWDNRDVPSRFVIVRYEDVVADPVRELRRIVNVLAWPSGITEILPEVANWGSFANLRALTARSPLHELGPTDGSDSESYKFRRGRAGGYERYLSREEAGLLRNKGRALHEAYGY